MSEHDLLNIYLFMCNVSFQIKQKLERVEMGGVLITYRSDIALQQRFFVSCVREGVNFPFTVRILSDTACVRASISAIVQLGFRLDAIVDKQTTKCKHGSLLCA